MNIKNKALIVSVMISGLVGGAAAAAAEDSQARPEQLHCSSDDTRVTLTIIESQATGSAFGQLIVPGEGPSVPLTCLAPLANDGPQFTLWVCKEHRNGEGKLSAVVLQDASGVSAVVRRDPSFSDPAGQNVASLACRYEAIPMSN